VAQGVGPDFKPHYQKKKKEKKAPMLQLWESRAALEEIGRTHPRTEFWVGCKGLTKRGHKCKVLQHHIMLQEPLNLIKEPQFSCEK
jgi:hypothetical protein